MPRLFYSLGKCLWYQLDLKIGVSSASLHVVIGGYVHHIVSADGDRKFDASYISCMMTKGLVRHTVALYLWDSRLGAL
jgi:hypothetical protein